MLRRRAFGRVLDVNRTQQAPTGTKTGPSARSTNDRCHWGWLGAVAASTSLITQRSSVQIRPPQPSKSTGYGQSAVARWVFPAMRSGKHCEMYEA